MSSIGASVAQADINSGLFAYYSFDDCTAQDSSKSALHGTISGFPACVTGRSGKALSFNDDNNDGDYIVLPSFEANAFKTGFSVCAWAQFEKNRKYERIIDLGNGSDSNNIAFARSSTSNDLIFSSYDNQTFHGLSANNAIKNASWKFYCASIDPTIKVGLIYIDAKLAASATQIPLINIKRVSNFIAHSNWPQYDRDFMGIMDEVRIYNRALTLQDIQELYYLGVPVSGSLNSLGSHTVSCTNNTTEESVEFPATQKTSFNCQAKGLVINPGDDVTITINGVNK